VGGLSFSPSPERPSGMTMTQQIQAMTDNLKGGGSVTVKDLENMAAQLMGEQEGQEGGGEMEEGEERSQRKRGMGGYADGFRVTNPDELCVDSWVHYAPDATMLQLEPQSDMVYDAVASSYEGVWTAAKTYARQEADPEDETITPQNEDTPTLRALCPGLWKQPELAWEAIRNLIRNGAIQQKKSTRGLLLFIPQKLGAGGRGKAPVMRLATKQDRSTINSRVRHEQEERGRTDTGGVNKIRKPNGS
jgi:hypothetical protein